MEAFKQVRQSYLRGAQAVLLVCNLSSQDSLMNVPQQIQTARSVSSEVWIHIVANRFGESPQSSVDYLARCAVRARAGLSVINALKDQQVKPIYLNIVHRIVAAHSASARISVS